ncbi:MAG: NAD(P)-dependent glycerol-3-phosphate dehydrogenase [Sedimentisphaerales bacterium]|nr:NAD(P)-dependent glycerol-3-phosphate dehydrogenase [Sedimentisphaerales bacterium]
MFKNISIIGDGGMGTVLGMLLCGKNLHVKIWGYDEKQLMQIAAAGENIKFLPGYMLPKNLEFEPGDKKIMAGTDLIISAVPCQFIRGIWVRLKNHTPKNIPIVSITKGIENKTLLRPSEIITEVLELSDDARLAALSGPTIADELARELPATACAAGSDEKLIGQIQTTLSTNWFRVYTNTDIVGVELAGAMKNIIAIAAGIIDGIGAGDNCKAALVTRGLTEITRLGMACGARTETFTGLTGLGDLVTTCISPTGRNRSFGEKIGKGQTIEQAQKSTQSVVEGIATCESVIELAKRKNVVMPITQAIYEVLFLNKPIKTAIDELMNRRLKAEVSVSAQNEKA